VNYSLATWSVTVTDERCSTSAGMNFILSPPPKPGVHMVPGRDIGLFTVTMPSAKDSLYCT